MRKRAARVRVSDRAPLDHPGEVVAPGRARHVQRLEDALAAEVGKRLPAHARHDDRREVVPAVAIRVARAGWEVERLLPAENVEDVRVCVDARGPGPAADASHAAPIPQAARVVQHVPDGERCAVIRQLRNMLAHRIVQRQLAILDEQQHRGGRELLRDRAGLEDRIGAIRRLVLEIGHAVALLQHILAIHADPNRAPRRRLVPAREDLVDLRIERRALLRDRRRRHDSAGDHHRRGDAPQVFTVHDVHFCCPNPTGEVFDLRVGLLITVSPSEHETRRSGEFLVLLPPDLLISCELVAGAVSIRNRRRTR